MMTETHYLFIHPLLSSDDHCAAYRCQYVNSADPAALLALLQADPEFAASPAATPWFFPAISQSEACPRIVPLFTAPPVEDAQRVLYDRLRQAGRKTALCLNANQPLPATGTWDFVEIRTGHARALPPYALLGLSTRSTLIASEVLTRSDLDWIRHNAFSLTSCEFLLNRSPSSKHADTTRTRLLRLLSLIADDASTSELEDVFRQEPKLAYSLLRLVNSAAVAPRTPIVSFSQAINLLGRRQLHRWLQLLVYADPDNGQRPNPLLLKAAARGHLLERLIAGQALPQELESPGDAAFMVGSFSLLDVLLNRPLPEILGQLPLAEPVRQALAEAGGVLGKLLDALRLAENGHPERAEALLEKLEISPAAHLQAQLATLRWVASIQPGL